MSVPVDVRVARGKLALEGLRYDMARFRLGCSAGDHEMQRIAMRSFNQRRAEYRQAITRLHVLLHAQGLTAVPPKWGVRHG